MAGFPERSGPEAPGISIDAVLRNAKDHTLREVIGAATLNVLAALDASLVTRTSLVEMAKSAAEPVQFLDRPALRATLISALPIAKARELAARLGLDPRKTSLFEALIERASDKRTRPLLAAFFGVVSAERAPMTAPPVTREVVPAYGLFEHQKSVADRALEAIRQPPFKAVVHMPTGSGKTRTAMHVIAQTVRDNPGKLVVWLAQSGELLEQAAGEFERAWRSLGSLPATVYRFWGDFDLDVEDVREGFLVAGLAKMHARYLRDMHSLASLADRAVLTIIDEAHQAIAPTYRTVIEFLQKKKPRNALLGLTATPGRTWANISDDAALSEFFDGRKITLSISGYKNPVNYLIDAGYLARPSFRTLNVGPSAALSRSDMSELSNSYDIPEYLLERLAADELRSVKIITEVEQLCRRHRRVILFASSVGHAHLIASILQLRGLRSFVVTALTDPVSRERMLIRYRSHDPEPVVICNFGVLTTGFDAPETSATLIARPTRSLVLYSQMVGRAIRGPRAGGNPAAEIVTVVDPQLPGFGDIAEAFLNWEDVWEDG